MYTVARGGCAPSAEGSQIQELGNESRLEGDRQWVDSLGIESGEEGTSLPCARGSNADSQMAGNGNETRFEGDRR